MSLPNRDRPSTPPETEIACEIRHPIALDRVRQSNQTLLAPEKARQMADFFSVLADPNRLRLLSALAGQELCVCDLAAILRMSESAVSHQLRTLREMQLVSYRRQGRKVYYALKDARVLDLYTSFEPGENEE